MTATQAQIRHLIWDFDGTLYDTYPLMAQALLAALAQYGKHVPYGELYTRIKHKLYPAIVTLAARFNLPVDALAAAYRAQRALQPRPPAMPGLAQCLRATAELGCHHYLFTHSDHHAIQQLATDGLAVYFSDYITREQGFADKPSPEAILHLMQKHGFTAKAALMIGDRDLDIQSAAYAGVAGVLFDPGQFFPMLNAAYRVQSLAEISGLLATQRSAES